MTACTTDTHAHPTPPGVLDLVAELSARRDPPGVMLERDDDYPPEPGPPAGERDPGGVRGTPGGAPVDRERLAAAHLSRSPARLAATLAGPPRRLVIVIRAPGLGDR